MEEDGPEMGHQLPGARGRQEWVQDYSQQAVEGQGVAVRYRPCHWPHVVQDAGTHGVVLCADSDEVRERARVGVAVWFSIKSDSGSGSVWSGEGTRVHGRGVDARGYSI